LLAADLSSAGDESLWDSFARDTSNSWIAADAQLY